MTMEVQNLHRRKSSKDEDEILVTAANLSTDTPTSPVNGPTPGLTRTRVNSTPQHPNHLHTPSGAAATHPPSAGPYRTSFAMPRAPNGINGHPSSPFRSTFSVTGPPPGHKRTQSQSQPHSRTRSISTPFSPPLPSPLSSSFPPAPPMHPFPAGMTTSHSLPDPSTSPISSTGPSFASGGPNNPAGPSSAPAKHSRRHSRLHSRNLSVFFPRPGSLPQTTIAEDGTQEVELHIDEEAVPVSNIPSAGSSVSFPSSARSARGSRGPGGGQPPTPLGAGFTFGARRPPSMSSTPSLSTDDGSTVVDTQESNPGTPNSVTTSRRGHHHKHSMSHNFFSFLEPGANRPPNGYAGDDGGEEGEGNVQLHTQPTPMPVSPWQPISPFPATPGPAGHSQMQQHQQLQLQAMVPPSALNGHASRNSMNSLNGPAEGGSRGATAVAVGQFFLGAWLWVCGQQIGSLATTGLGYWVVFDAFGVGLRWVFPGWLNAGREVDVKVRRPYGNARVETVMMFAQSVYLMFSSVYVCKETVEHLLLSAGGAEGHHHHHGDEEGFGQGIEFPLFLMFLTLLSLFGTALLYDNHSKLLNITGNRIPSPGTLIRSLSASKRTQHQFYDPPPTTPLAVILSNPYIASPLFFCTAILTVALLVPSPHHRICDLFLASLITIITGKVAYKASVVLGTVLLQTSPPRGMASGRMEAFLRAMREVERHPQVLHLPAPHIWQLAPSPAGSGTSAPTTSGKAQEESLVVTMELHVREDLGDDDVLALTKWAWERCVAALGGGAAGKGKGTESGAEVTVGIVRG